MEKEKALFIVNPISGTGKQGNFTEVLNKSIDNSLFDFDISYTEHRGHATLLSKHAVNKYQYVFAVGGDGTVNEVARGLIESDCIMGIVPVGSGNGLARHLGLSMKVSEAIQVLNKRKIQSIDTAIINNQEFVNVAGVGFDAHVAHLYANTKKRGPIPYVKMATQEFHKYIPKRYEIEIDGESYHQTAFVISFANSSQFGNNAYISPNALINDGLLDVCIMREFPKVEAGQLAIKLFNKRLDKSKYMKIVPGKNIRIISEEKIPGHIDGEPIHFPNEIEIKINPSSLKVIFNSEKGESILDKVQKSLTFSKVQRNIKT